MIKIWNPTLTETSSEHLIGVARSMTYSGISPLTAGATELLCAISTKIFDDPYARKVPQFVALAFWLRRSALTRLIDRLQSDYDTSDAVYTPRGLALHLPPTNVDTIFVYSWAISVLAGNCNIVRMPTDLDAPTKWLVELVVEAVESAGQSHRHLFCTFPHSSNVLGDLSALSDLRMIWGGDAKVEQVSKHPVRPDGLSIGFPDRTSFAVINADTYASISDAARSRLAADLFNDLYWFDQMGCGSPRMIFWVGGKSDSEHMSDLNDRLAYEIDKKQYTVNTSIAISKFNFVNSMLVDEYATGASLYNNQLHVLETTTPDRAMTQKHGGGVLFFANVRSLLDVSASVTRATQTVVHYGFNKEELMALAQSMVGRGGYRIVPPGKALQFDINWDGIPLFAHMTRIITLDM